VEFRFGDVVELATDIPDSDLVTLDRVVCCYPDEVLLLSIASSKARRWLALSYPRNRFPMRVGIAAVNLFERVFGDGFRVFVRPEEHIRAEVMRHGFESRFEQQTVFWQVSVFERTRQHLLT
jgi:magnesium-protoporphyrin O-methyltransferase